MKRNLIKYLLISVLFLNVGLLSAQQTVIFEDVEHNYFKALELYNKQQYGAAQKLFVSTIDQLDDPNHNLTVNAEYYRAICAVHLFNNDAEVLLRKFIQDHPQNANIKYIYFQLGNFQYSKKNYRAVLKSFQNVDKYDLSGQERIEYHFKYGYSYFTIKQIDKAADHFFQIINKDSKFKTSAIYYYSHIAYTQKNYQTALKGFLSLKEDETFKPVVPYYVTHIYYLQGNYKELLNIAPSLHEKATPGRKPEIARLIGEAYYRTGKYKEAIPFLNEYHKDAGEYASPQEQYQMAFSYYKLGQYAKSVDYFKHITIGSDSLAQNANYHMAFCYAQMGKKKFALHAFQAASKIEAVDHITEDALYNFAKLSYELSYNPYNQAINAFNLYLKRYPESEYREELVGYLSKMYLSTRNYQKALEAIENIKMRSPELEQAYQRVLYLRGVELFNSAKYDESVAFFDRAITSNQNPKFTTESMFWKAEALYREKYYKQSIASFQRYLNNPNAFGTNDYASAYYSIGYAYFKQKNYNKALENFRLYLINEKAKKVDYISDAYLRTADCYLVTKELDKAIENYDQALSMNQANMDYALVKKAEALGAQLKFQDKALVLQQLLNDYPRSTYYGITEYLLAQNYFQNLDDKRMALKHYSHLIETHPKSLSYVKQAMLDLGLVYYDMEEHQQAIKAFKEVVTHFRSSEESKVALKRLSSLYTEINQPDEYFAFVKSLGINPSIDEQDKKYFESAQLLVENGDCSAAMEALKKYIELFPAGSFVAQAHYYWGDCLYSSGQHDEALTHYIKVAGMPVMEYTLSSYMKIADLSYYKKHDYQRSLEAYRQALKMSTFKNDRNSNLIGIMNSQFKLNRYNEVLKAVDNVLDIENLKEEIRIDAYMKKAKSYIALEDYTNARAKLTDIIILSKSEPSSEARYLLAWIAFELAEYDKAESLVYDVIEKDPSYEYWIVKGFVLMADIYVKKDNNYQAKATLQSVLNGYDKDQDLVNEAKTKLALIIAEEEKEKEKNKKAESDVEIEFNNNDDMFGEEWDDSDLEEIEIDEEELEEEE